MRREEAGEVPRSALEFEQQYGNNHGRFGSVDQTYIAAALATGKVTLKPLTEVTDIRREHSGEYVAGCGEQCQHMPRVHRRPYQAGRPP